MAKGIKIGDIINELRDRIESGCEEDSREVKLLNALIRAYVKMQKLQKGFKAEKENEQKELENLREQVVKLAQAKEEAPPPPPPEEKGPGKELLAWCEEHLEHVISLRARAWGLSLTVNKSGSVRQQALRFKNDNAESLAALLDQAIQELDTKEKSSRQKAASVSPAPVTPKPASTRANAPKMEYPPEVAALLQQIEQKQAPLPVNEPGWDEGEVQITARPIEEDDDEYEDEAEI